MRRLGGLLVLVLALAGCGDEVAPRAGSTPSLGLRAIEPPDGTGAQTPGAQTPGAQTPGVTQPAPFPATPLPRRPELPASAYQQISVVRLQTPNAALQLPPDGYAQVIFACSYEEWSPQYEYNATTNYNPPGRHLRGDKVGDFLGSISASEVGRALGSAADPTADDWMARSYTEDSWPDRRLVTAYQVKRVNLTRAKVLAARNAYAKGCSVKYTAPLLDAVRVSIYAPWNWSI